MTSFISVVICIFRVRQQVFTNLLVLAAFCGLSRPSRAKMPEILIGRGSLITRTFMNL
jgi:hypothetical protein